MVIDNINTHIVSVMIAIIIKYTVRLNIDYKVSCGFYCLTWFGSTCVYLTMTVLHWFNCCHIALVCNMYDQTDIKIKLYYIIFVLPFVLAGFHSEKSIASSILFYSSICQQHN